MVQPLIALEQMFEVAPESDDPEDFESDDLDSDDPDADELDVDELEPVQFDDPIDDEPVMSEEKKAQKSLLSEMRSLLRDYPMKLDLRQVENLRDLIHDLLLIYDLLAFVAYKTTKEDIKALAMAEIAEFDRRVNVREIRRLWMKTHRRSHFANRSGTVRIEHLLRLEMNFLADKVQFYALAVPSKDKPYMHLKNAQGLPAATADEFESSEIQEGEKIGPDTSFKVDDEGKVIPLN